MSTLLDSGCHASLCNVHDGINLFDILILVATLQDEYPISVCNLPFVPTRVRISTHLATHSQDVNLIKPFKVRWIGFLIIWEVIVKQGQ